MVNGNVLFLFLQKKRRKKSFSKKNEEIFDEEIKKQFSFHQANETDQNEKLSRERDRKQE